VEESLQAKAFETGASRWLRAEKCTTSRKCAAVFIRYSEWKYERLMRWCKRKRSKKLCTEGSQNTKKVRVRSCVAIAGVVGPPWICEMVLSTKDRDVSGTAGRTYLLMRGCIATSCHILPRAIFDHKRSSPHSAYQREDYVFGLTRETNI
jgi:hypothetical protein